jgi:hypothetical protein
VNGSSPINSPKGPVDMRDIHALQLRLMAQSEENARKILTAHLRVLEVIGENEARAVEHRREIKGELAELRAQQKTMLGYLERLVVALPDKDIPRASVPAEVPAPAAGWLARAARARAVVARRLDGPVTMRAVVYGFAIAGVGASLTSCALYFVR